jgi:hypothetical protein
MATGANLGLLLDTLRVQRRRRGEQGSRQRDQGENARIRLAAHFFPFSVATD